MRLMRLMLLTLATLPVLAGCASFVGDPAPPAPTLTGVQAQSTAWVNEIRRSPDNDDSTFAPLTQARQAVAAAKAQPHVGDYDANALQQSEQALSRAEEGWANLADRNTPPADDLADIARAAHRAQRLAEIARFTALRETGLDQLDNALQQRNANIAAATSGAELAGRKVIPGRFGDVHFELGTARLTDDSHAVVVELAKLMQRQPGYGVAIYGHTDNSPPSAATLKAFVKANPGLEKQAPGHGDKVAAFNLALSAARARAVARELVSDGVDASRIGARGFGDRRPVASNDTAQGRRANRRVVAVLVPMQDKAAAQQQSQPAR